ncbi:MAG: DUF1009 domain-containing protein, partial [Pseudomonadota bacterium]
MNAQSPLGLIAGGGDLPQRIAEYVSREGREIFVLGVQGFVEDKLLNAFPSERISIGEIGKQMELLKRERCEDVVFAGVVRRPDFKSLKLDIRGAALLPKVLSAARKGDDALLRTLVTAFEAEGFRVVGADDVLGGLVVGPGALGELSPTDAHW